MNTKSIVLVLAFLVFLFVPLADAQQPEKKFPGSVIYRFAPELSRAKRRSSKVCARSGTLTDRTSSSTGALPKARKTFFPVLQLR